MSRTADAPQRLRPAAGSPARLPLLGSFREAWLNAPYPMLVEYADDGNESICPAPSLWVGGRMYSEQLKNLGVGPGHRVLVAVPYSALWVQVMVGCLRRGATLCAMAGGVKLKITAEREQAEANQVQAHVVVDGGAAIRVVHGQAPLGDPEVLWSLGAEGGVLTAEGLQGLADEVVGLWFPRREMRVWARSEDPSKAAWAQERLGALAGGAEVHVGLKADEGPARLRLTGSAPEVGFAIPWRDEAGGAP